MPLAITASPHLATPSRAYCIAPTSRSPRFSPSLAHVCPRRKNSNQNALGSKGSCLTGFSHFGFGGKICFSSLLCVKTKDLISKYLRIQHTLQSCMIFLRHPEHQTGMLRVAHRATSPHVSSEKCWDW